MLSFCRVVFMTCSFVAPSWLAKLAIKTWRIAVVGYSGLIMEIANLWLIVVYPVRWMYFYNSMIYISWKNCSGECFLLTALILFKIIFVNRFFTFSYSFWRRTRPRIWLMWASEILCILVFPVLVLIFIFVSTKNLFFFFRSYCFSSFLLRFLSILRKQVGSTFPCFPCFSLVGQLSNWSILYR